MVEGGGVVMVDEESYRAEVEAWRAAQEAALRAPEGWLSLAGLHWLNEGANRVGGGDRNEVALPADAAPAFVGELCLHEGVVTVGAARASLLLNNAPPEDRPLRDDADPAPDRLSVGRLSMQVIRRGARVGVRVRDPERPARGTFPGRRWFPVQPAYRLRARLEPYDPPRPIAITNVLGDTADELSPGAVVFSLDGRELRLDARSAPDGGLIILFRDRTSGDTTYGAGRTLRTPPPVAGVVDLDFNRAANPWCAFTPFATCPLPPPQNRLPLAIPAGELAPPEHT